MGPETGTYTNDRADNGLEALHGILASLISLIHTTSAAFVIEVAVAIGRGEIEPGKAGREGEVVMVVGG